VGEDGVIVSALLGRRFRAVEERAGKLGDARGAPRVVLLRATAKGRFPKSPDSPVENDDGNDEGSRNRDKEREGKGNDKGRRRGRGKERVEVRKKVEGRQEGATSLVDNFAFSVDVRDRVLEEVAEKTSGDI
jgi:hypothetical protein